MSAGPDYEAMVKDKEEKKQLVVDQISEQSKSSDFEDLKAIAKALEEGDKLEAKILTGGQANYTYKVYLSGSPDKAVFAKLSFPFFQIFPDKPCPLERTEHEFSMMKTVNNLLPGSAVIPYFCMDVDSMKLLVTQWSPLDEQWANQFIDGSVSMKYAKQLASILQELHCAEFDKDFNLEMKPYMDSLSPIANVIFEKLLAEGCTDERISTIAKDIGNEKFKHMMAESQKIATEVVESYVHGDFHVFNILTARKPGIESLIDLEDDYDGEDDDGGDAGIVACDWEISHAGASGKDFGVFRSFPLACALANAVNGNKHAAHDILQFLDATWEEYEMAMKVKGGRTDEDMHSNFCHGLVQGSQYLFGFYGLGVFMDLLPIEGGNKDDLTQVKESVGILGLKTMQLGTTRSSPDLTLKEVKSKYKELVDEQVEYLLTVNKDCRMTRRSSRLRQSGRRISDAVIHFQDARRLSDASSVSAGSP